MDGMGIDSSNMLPCQIFLMDGNYMSLPSNIVALAIRSLPKTNLSEKTQRSQIAKIVMIIFPLGCFQKYGYLKMDGEDNGKPY